MIKNIKKSFILTEYYVDETVSKIFINLETVSIFR